MFACVCLWALRLTWWIALPPYSFETGLSQSNPGFPIQFVCLACITAGIMSLSALSGHLLSAEDLSSGPLACGESAELPAPQPVFPLVICAYKRVQVRLDLALSHELLPTQ